VSFLIGLLMKGALGFGVPQRFARVAGIVGLVLFLVIGLGVAKCAYDRSIIEEHDAKQEVKAVRTTLKRERAANTAETKERAADEAKAAQVKGAIDNAVQAQPTAARGSSGPASSAALRVLRERQRQQHGRDGEQPPGS
jgi:hypothetical protein